MGIPEALIASAIVGTGTQVVQGERARKDAKKETRKQEAATRRSLAEKEAQEKTMAMDAERDAQRARQRAASQSFGGRQSTILTGNQSAGAAGVGTGTKTLLGM